MADCCANAGCEIERLRLRQSRTLKTVLAINAAMFVVEVAAGMAAGSTSLLADSLDMLGDALVYAFSLYVVSKDGAWKAASALFKGAIMAAFGLFVLGQAAYKFIHPATPGFEVIGIVGVAALGANAFCLYTLWGHRGEDVNMRSVWLCSRNDIIANVSVIFAAFGVWAFDSQWPDLVVGLGIAVLFLRSSVHVITDGIKAYRAHAVLQP